MNLDNVIAVDIETTGLLDVVKSRKDLHVFSYARRGKNGEIITSSTNSEEDIEKFLSNPNLTIVIHNAKTYDEVVLKDVMGYEIKANIIDSLPISYYLYSEKDKHGLEEWGEYFKVPKPKIEDWQALSYEEYKNRCEEDCKINLLLWEQQLEYLRELYETDERVISMVKYLNFKAQVLQSKQKHPLFLDLEFCEECKITLENIIGEKEEELKRVMPKVKKYAVRSKPKIMYKKDGTLSASGHRWEKMLDNLQLPKDYDGAIKEVVKLEEPNPSSSKQMKDWLFSLGWKPLIYKDGENGKVAQLRNDNKELCKSVLELAKTIPELKSLEGLSVASHRLGYIKSFLEKSDEKGNCSQWASGFTRTLRLKHTKPFVNLPKANSEYGEMVRGSIVAPKGHILMAADLSSIEDKCKQISIYEFDKEYVETMNKKGWDAHLALGVVSGIFTQDESDFYKYMKGRGKEYSPEIPPKYITTTETEKDELFGKLDIKRANCKTGTYALSYGSGIPNLVESTGLTNKVATELYNGFHKLNWAVKEFAETRPLKVVRQPTWLRKNKKAGGLVEVKEAKWIFNKHTNIWTYLKSDKDKFSSCNQSFGVKIFDTWCKILYDKGVRFSFTMQDEILSIIKEEDKEYYEGILKESIKKLNEVFKFPVPIEADYQFGYKYSEVH